MHDLDEMVECPVCHAQGGWEEMLMGPLGDRLHFRCFACHAQWSEEADELEMQHG